VRKRVDWIAIIPAIAYFYFQFAESGSKSAQLAHYALQFTLLILATLSLAGTAFREQRKDLWNFWSRLATACGLWALATVMETTEILLAQPRFGTVADGSWVGGYVVILAALLHGASVFRGWKTKAALQPAAIWLVFGVLLAAVIQFWFMPKVERTLVLLLGYVYYFGDVFTAFLAILCALGSGVTEELRRPLRIIMIATVVFYFSDLVVILQHLTKPLDRWSGVGYGIGYFLMYRAGLEQTTKTQRH
jgi:hypothetical protein